MICATVSSRSCLRRLDTAFPSSGTKNIINLILVLTRWWSPCVKSSLCCWKRVFAMTSTFSWQNSVNLCPASFCSPRPNLPVTPGISWLLLDSNPWWWIEHLFWVLVLGGLLGLHRTDKRQLLHHPRGIDLDYCDVEWLALETNQDHSGIFEVAPKYCISDSLADYKGYSISSMGFLPTIVDKMVSWIKFAHSHSF